MNNNIAILIISLAGGGGEREASILANHFCKDRNTTLVLLNDTIVYELDERVKVHYLENKPLKKRALINILKLPMLGYRYYKFCKANNIQTTISFLNRTNLIAGFSRIFGNTTKIFMCQVTTLNKAYAAKSIGNKLMKGLSKMLYPKADAVISNSKGSAIEMTRDYGIQKSYTVYNPLDLDMIAEKSAVEVTHPPDASKFSYIMVARFTYPKDFETLLTAFSYFEGDEEELLLLGDGEDREAAEKLAEKLGIESKVHFLGFSQNVFAYLAKADCFVFSSMYEGFPNSMQEAMACGLPVVSSDCHYGPREMLMDDFQNYENIFADSEYYVANSGILVPLSSPRNFYAAMKRMKDDSSLYQKLKQRAHSKAQDYAVDKIAKQFENLII